jgi:glycerophosphoryl diester phosphodiesterase
MMRSGRLTIRFLILLTLLLMLPSAVFAQGNAQLVGYAILPAGTVTDGGPAGKALAGNVNGLSMPFASQPLGSVTGVVPGDYPGVWLVLTNGTFQNPNQSSDFLLRIYTVQTDLRNVNGGSGSANPVDWLVLADPRKLLGNIALGSSRSRNLTGADLTPRAFVRLPDGSYWVADAKNNQLLHFDGQGKLLAAPTSAGGVVAGLSMTPGGDHLVVALRDGLLQLADPASGAIMTQRGNYGADGGASIGGISMISESEALVIEIDGRDGANGVKRVYLANLDTGSKALLADLLNIDDPNGLSGLGSPFTFPYAAINGVAVTSNGNLLVVNNNRVPFGEGRQPGSADSTEFIEVQVGQSLFR